MGNIDKVDSVKNTIGVLYEYLSMQSDIDSLNLIKDDHIKQIGKLKEEILNHVQQIEYLSNSRIDEEEFNVRVIEIVKQNELRFERDKLDMWRKIHMLENEIKQSKVKELVTLKNVEQLEEKFRCAVCCDEHIQYVMSC